MPSNIEIKARVSDLGTIRAVVEPISDRPVEVLDQEDIFFAAPERAAEAPHPGRAAG